ncbi:uncharacterized protein LOC143057513 [Mytilus galloprovincialis]|uniref:uncharacterized protein LOC143057513 n=1 Tax=Mytilus galloprovincialis TaxID=29158 RepID=UPI003F7CA015
MYYWYDYMTYRDFRVERNSGGICKAPNCCENCNSGFYADCNGYCTICPPIQNCVHRTCEAYYGSNNKCEYCKYENTHQRYERAYKYHDDKKICERMYVLQYKLCQF